MYRSTGIGRCRLGLRIPDRGWDGPLLGPIFLFRNLCTIFVRPRAHELSLANWLAGEGFCLTLFFSETLILRLGKVAVVARLFRRFPRLPDWGLWSK